MPLVIDRQTPTRTTSYLPTLLPNKLGQPPQLARVPEPLLLLMATRHPNRDRHPRPIHTTLLRLILNRHYASNTQVRHFSAPNVEVLKGYNDTFGHPAGDALLARLSDKLSATVAAHGTAYRMGGDEFCVLLRSSASFEHGLEQTSVAALSEHGPGFAISAAHGEASIPGEAAQPAAILQLADQRLYQRKDQSRESGAVLALRDVLLQAFQERYPDLRAHQHGVGTLVLALGRRMGLDGEELDVLARAAELHDVGKIAIPDAILGKPDRLDEEEWRFMRRHTILGERILMAASALRPVARLVRASHERFDGGGYPDGLRGQEIPLGARIIFVCDAYDAMTSERAYSPAVTPAEAIAELRACAGAQFDPDIVDAFVQTLGTLGTEEPAPVVDSTFFLLGPS